MRRKTARASTFGLIFQSTHPRGVRRNNRQSDSRPVHFNPRTREGCDVFAIMSTTAAPSISIHAPARGATNTQKRTKKYARFQSTHPRGVRPDFSGHVIDFIISIHAPARGATQCSLRSISSIANFNPRTREGCDCWCQAIRGMFYISIHAPARDACF